ncbi:monooxygenase [Microbacterium ulmi]|uniref:Monooxygenase n=1 Tax=Microbacterium ulmi TaxID=179095 RepID=A0A7Y2M1K2_9MICO|nr:monooxygenase [Microbacterium ulmi]NII68631.1 hypothetical protein [Microbacterium ulmi]NNH04801.1 monooxygenase [Microbacterium ulmi]
MAHLLVFEFPSHGPFGAEALEAYRGLAEDIAGEEGLVWKVWTEDAEAGLAGGVYLFATKADGDRYLALHTRRLQSLGVTDIEASEFAVNEGLSRITRAPLA